VASKIDRDGLPHVVCRQRLFDAIARRVRIDHHALQIVGGQFPHCSGGEVGVGANDARSSVLCRAFGGGPLREQALGVGDDRLGRRVGGGRAHDDAMPGPLGQFERELAQSSADLGIADPFTDSGRWGTGQEDEVTTRDTDVARQHGTLRTDRGARDLRDDPVPHGVVVLDTRALLPHSADARQVGDVQERVAVGADVDEGRADTRLEVHDTPATDVAGTRAGIGGLAQEFRDAPLDNDGRTRVAGNGGVDQQLGRHGREKLPAAPR